jgi:hypothetical protein
MHALSEYARFILDRMEPDRRYEPQDLRAFVLDTSIEHLHEIMHELWVNRHVERVGYSAWRRHRSEPPHAARPVAREIKPQRLFDDALLPEFFK